FAIESRYSDGVDRQAANREQPVLVWKNAAGQEVCHPLCDRCFFLWGCQHDATWLPDGWGMDLFPTGWTLPHLEASFRYAEDLAGDDRINNTRGDIPPGSDVSPSYLPTPRGLVTHAHLIVRHLELPNPPSEPRIEMTRAGCLAELRDSVGSGRAA